jgi:lysophospholipase L1-like esterase
LTDPRSHGGRYLDVLRQRCPRSRFDSYGVGGQMVNQMHARFDRDILGEPPGDEPKPRYTDVIVFGGVNDLYSDLTAGRTVDKIEADLSAMYASARSHGMRVVAVTVTPWGGFHKYYNEHRARTTAALNAWILHEPPREVDAAVDAFHLLSCGNPEELCPAYATPFKDGLHFGAAGHAALGEALYQRAFSDCE